MMPTVLMYALQVLQSLPTLLAAGQSVTTLVHQANDALAKMQAEKRDPTPEEWDALNSTISGLRDQLHN